MRKSVYKMLEEVSLKKTKKEKIAALQAISSPQLKTILGYTFDPNVVWLLPETAPPYKALNENQDQESALFSNITKLYLYVDGPTATQKNLKQSKRELLFIQLLESIDPNDAILLLSMKNKKLPFSGLTKKLVSEAFPILAKDW